MQQPTFPRPLPFCLVIDQSLTVRKVLETELRRANYPPCATFADAIEALRAIALQQVPVPDIVLVSWRLPKLDGVDVLRLMKRERYHTAGVTLLDRDQDSPLMRVKAKLAGAQKTLVKPFTMQEFLQTIAAIRYTS